ncbi:MAG: hypothetical protein WC558_05030 [Patulibacter sp.]
MSSDFDANDDLPGDDSAEGLSLPALEQQITERMAKLYAAAEEFYKLQVLLDAIDGREPLPVPEYLAGMVAEVPPLLDEQRRRQARERVTQRIALVTTPPARRRGR